ncbi:DNA-binding transcriptional LysR family regulator [Bradyrhizobium elkanii]
MEDVQWWVGCSTTFLSHGLLPRIGRFRQLYQDIDFVFETDADLDALAVGAVDVLFVSGLLKRPLPVREVHVSNEMIGPVCAPAMLETIKSPADILSIPLLHEAARMDGWNEWASAAAICLQGSRLVVFDTFPWLSRQQKVGLAPQYLRKFWFEATLRRENLWLRLALRRSIAQSTCLSMGTREIWRLLKSLNDGSCQKYSVRIRYRLCRLQLERSSGPLSIRLRPMRASKR